MFYIKKNFILLFIILSTFLTFSKAQNLSSSDTQLIKRIASDRNELISARTRCFKDLKFTDQNKAAGIIDELLNRAEQKILNELPKGRFDWSWAGFDKPDSMVIQAEGFLKILDSGKDPFKDTFAEPGGYVVDHALIEKNGLIHLFYIRGVAATNWPDYPLRNFGHAVSKDLINWRIEKPVLQCPEAGWDDFQIWAPYILKHDGKYWMFYAGVNKNVCQAIGLATSDDLYHWKRYGKNPVITTAPWGLWDSTKWSDCRDPMVLQDGDNFYCYYTAARINPETKEHEYCLGISWSKDLLNWKDKGFIRLVNSLKTLPESPFVVKHNRMYYLFYTNYKYGTVYATSKNPTKDWHELPVDKMTVIKSVSASEIFKSGDNWYISFISHMKNSLHFFEIRRLVWNSNGSIFTEKLKE